MVTKNKKLFFRTAMVILDDEAIPDLVASGTYGKITAISYRGTVPRGFETIEKTTGIIDLTRSEEDIFASFRKTMRNEIRRTERTPELRFVSNDKNFGEGYRLYAQFEKARGVVPFSKKEFQRTKLFSAYYNGEMVSGVFVYPSEPVVRIRSIFSKRHGTSDKQVLSAISNSTRRIMWDICRWAKNQGRTGLDLASINLNNPKTASISDFKMGFSPEIVPEYTHVYKTPLFKIFEKFITVKLWFRKVFV